MEVRVRKLGPDDTATARALIRVFHERAVSEAYLAGLLADSSNLLLVAEAAGEVIGFVWAHWLDRLARERKHMFLYEIEVAPPHRRKGVGTELMAAVFSEARSSRADVFLFTNHSNPGAVRFYRHLGGTAKNGDDLLFVYPYGEAPDTPPGGGQAPGGSMGNAARD